MLPAGLLVLVNLSSAELFQLAAIDFVSATFKTERVGFEPTVSLRPHWISSPAQSATLSPLLRTSTSLVRGYDLVVPITFQHFDSFPPNLRSTIIACRDDQRQGSSRNPCVKKMSVRWPGPSIAIFHPRFFVGISFGEFCCCQNSEREAVCLLGW